MRRPTTKGDLPQTDEPAAVRLHLEPPRGEFATRRPKARARFHVAGDIGEALRVEPLVRAVALISSRICAFESWINLSGCSCSTTALSNWSSCPQNPTRS
jgi:hypothetical protein